MRLRVKGLPLSFYLGLALLAAAYFFTRLFQLMDFPIFNDEAIYARWVQLASYLPEHRFISLSDGKQPLFVWIAIAFMRVFNDPLLATRLVSVSAGFGTVVGMGILAFQLSGKRTVAFLSSLLVIFYPFSLVLDRMGLYESLLGSITIWSMVAGVYLVRQKTLGSAFLLAHILSAGILTKTTALATLCLSPTLLLVNQVFSFRKKNLPWRALILIFFAIVLSLLYSSVLFLAPHIQRLFELQGIYSYTLVEMARTDMLSVFLQNISKTSQWIATYTGIVFIIIAALGFTQKTMPLRYHLLLFLWFLVPFIGINTIGKQLYPRYLYHMTLPLMPLAAAGIYYLIDTKKLKIAGILISSALLMQWMRTDFYIITDMAKADIPKDDLNQYVNGWPAGKGLNEIMNKLRNESWGSPVIVYSEGTYGSLPTTTFTMYLSDNQNIDIRTLEPIPEILPDEILLESMETPIFIVTNKYQKIPDWNAEIVLEIQKGTGDSYIRLYRIVKPLRTSASH